MLIKPFGEVVCSFLRAAINFFLLQIVGIQRHSTKSSQKDFILILSGLFYS